MPKFEHERILQQDFCLVPMAIGHLRCLQGERQRSVLHQKCHAQEATRELQEKVLSWLASVEEDGIGEGGPEPESHTGLVPLWRLPGTLVVCSHVDEEVDTGCEGEGGWRGTGGAIETRVAAAQVAVGLRLVGGDAQGLVLATVVLAPSQLHRAVLPTPGNAVWTKDAMADVVSDAIFAGSSVLAGVVFALVNVSGTLHTWCTKEGRKEGAS